MADSTGASVHANDPAATDDALPEPREEDHPAGTPRLAAGVRWSDILAEIRRDNQLRDAA